MSIEYTDDKHVNFMGKLFVHVKLKSNKGAVQLTRVNIQGGIMVLHREK